MALQCVLYRMLTIEIKDCYYVPGSVIEDGVMIRRDAPVENVVKL